MVPASKHKKSARQCVSQLYVVMPPLSAVDSLKIIQKERNALILGLSQDPTDKLLLDIVRALTAFAIWCQEQDHSADISCMIDTYHKLLNWAAGQWALVGANYDWNIITSWILDNVDSDISDIAQTTRNVKLTLALKQSWRSMCRINWTPALAKLPTELVAVLSHWHTVKA